MTAPIDIPAIRARAEAAHAGPWRVSDSHGLCVTLNGRDGDMVADLDFAGDNRADAAFIAAARTDVPALCDEVERLRALVAEACALATSFDVHGSQPEERDRIVAIRKEATGG